MTKPCTVISFLLLVANLASADVELVLTGSHPPGSPLVTIPNTVSSEHMEMRISRAPSLEPSDEGIAGWQVTLQLHPDDGSTGVVRFSTASEASDYIFASIDNYGISINSTLSPLPNDELLAFDFNYPYSGGVPIPSETDANGLLALDFVASSDASGVFGVYAAPMPWSEWTSTLDSRDGEREFGNLPKSGAPVRIGEVLVDPSLSALQPGDADRDLDFDQFDLILVLKAAKYRTGQPATWGEGDWNGAPGGHPGSPPIGNGIFDQFDIIAAQKAAIYQTGPYASSKPTDGFSQIVFDADVSAVDDGQMFEAKSTSEIAFAAFRSISPAYQDGGAADRVAAAVPEPAAGLLLAIGLIGLLLTAHRRARPLS